MNKNIIIILLIFVVPLGVYFGLTRNKLTELPAIASQGAQVVKFASPMCYECQQLEKVFEEVFPNYENDIELEKIDVTQKSDKVKAMIKKHQVKLVPTTVFKDKTGKVVRQIEGTMEPEVLENYLREIKNNG